MIYFTLLLYSHFFKKMNIKEFSICTKALSEGKNGGKISSGKAVGAGGKDHNKRVYNERFFNETLINTLEKVEKAIGKSIDLNIL